MVKKYVWIYLSIWAGALSLIQEYELADEFLPKAEVK